MKSTLKLIEYGISRSGSDFGKGIPFQYKVTGFLDDQDALIAKDVLSWQILRIKKDKKSDWYGTFPTPEAALAALQAEVDAE